MNDISIFKIYKTLRDNLVTRLVFLCATQSPITGLKDDRQMFLWKVSKKAVSNSLLQCKHVWVAQMDE